MQLPLLLGIFCAAFGFSTPPTNTTAPAKESWLFVQKAKTCSFEHNEDGTFTMVLGGLSKQTTAFTDRPFRTVRKLGTDSFMSRFAELFGIDIPNGSILFESEDDSKGPFVAEFSAQGNNAYVLSQSEAQTQDDDLTTIDTSKEYSDCVLFIDDVLWSIAMAVVSVVDPPAAAMAVVSVVETQFNDANVPTDYRPALAHVALAFAAYCGTAVTAAMDCYWCKKVKGFTFQGTFGTVNSAGFGFVGCLGDAAEVSIRGTDNLVGWIKDAEFNQVEWPGGNSELKVHSGFFNVYQTFKDDMKTLIKSANCKTNEVVVTGHSLGASLATLAAIDLATDTTTNWDVSLVNFGSPRVGNDLFSTYVESNIAKGGKGKIWRFTHNEDPVPHLPFESMGYHHVPLEIWIHNGYTTCNGSGEDKDCADSVDMLNPFDHGTYMGVNALDGVDHGCLWTDEYKNWTTELPKAFCAIEEDEGGSTFLKDMCAALEL